MSERLQLTEELRCKLRDAGFRYFLITHVELETTSKKLKSITVHPVKSIPIVQKHSCTAIDDAMIVDTISNPRTSVCVFVELNLS